MVLTKAIVRKPCIRITEGLSSEDLGLPDYKLALHQHDLYVHALRECRLEVTILDADNSFPDSTFVEDTALLTPAVAIITNPGATSRKGEIDSMIPVIKDFYQNIKFIRSPGTLEAGDVMMTGSHFYIGLSERTNLKGAQQLISILEAYGMSGSVIEVADMLHLKSGVSYLESNVLLTNRSVMYHPNLKGFQMIEVPDNETYAANSLWINGVVLVPEGYPVTLENIRNAGYETIVLDMSEFRKLDGGLSCLSLRF